MPRSRHADDFNHDADAAGYDTDVRNGADPIRAGYAALLDWVAAHATGRVLDLGTGTGNLLQRVHADSALAVDVSANMLERARARHYTLPVQWLQQDLLACFDVLADSSFDSIISTYAIHHLTEDEKHLLLDATLRVLRPGGVAAFGDLMFEHERTRLEVLRELAQAGHAEAAAAADEEFFWDLASARQRLQASGAVVQVKRFSLLSWGLSARCPGR